MSVKIVVLSAGVAFVGLFMSGCSSPQSHVNATGKWSYRYADDRTGTMELHLQDYKVTGVANDENWQYALDGKIDNAISAPLPALHGK